MSYFDNAEEACRAQWGKLIDDLNHSVRTERTRREKAEARVLELEQDAAHGRAFLSMMKATRENDVARGAWDKFVATLRLCGYD